MNTLCQVLHFEPYLDALRLRSDVTSSIKFLSPQVNGCQRLKELPGGMASISGLSYSASASEQSAWMGFF